MTDRPARPGPPPSAPRTQGVAVLRLAVQPLLAAAFVLAVILAFAHLMN